MLSGEMFLQAAIFQLFTAHGADGRDGCRGSRERGQQGHIHGDGCFAYARAVAVGMRPQRGVNDQGHLAGTDQVHHMGRILGQFINSFHRQPHPAEEFSRAGCGIQGKAHAMKIAGDLQAGAFIVIIDADQHRAILRQTFPRGQLGLGKRQAKIGGMPHHLTGRSASPVPVPRWNPAAY